MTDNTVHRMRWWGWGTDGNDGPIPDGAQALLEAACGMPQTRSEPVDLDAVKLPAAALSKTKLTRLAKVIGADNVKTDPLTRVSFGYGRSYPDLVRLRTGDGSGAADAVLFPGTPEEVASLLTLCATERIAVIPFGGGTSVCGGVEALRGEFDAAVAISLTRLDRLVQTDEEAMTATVQAGVFGPDLEQKLQSRGLTLGHYPQSYEFSTVGGWVATRSAGQQSTGYGRIDELVIGLRCATPTGEVALRPMPATAAGPDPRQLFTGSEGTLGIITESTLRVRPAPQVWKWHSYFFPSFESGAAALRMLEQSHSASDIARLSDGFETEFGLATMHNQRLKSALTSYLELRGQTEPCLMVLGYSGDAGEVRSRQWKARRKLLGSGGTTIGDAPAKIWVKGRFKYPYLRDELMSRGMLVDTLETCTTWDNTSNLHAAVGDAIRASLAERGTPAYVGCHISHLYATGCSLYFTIFAQQEVGAELAQWRAMKTAASDAIVNNGGTITHHHALGRDHAPWLAAETSELWLEVLRAAKKTVDPVGIMNPGKLMDPAALSTLPG